MRKVTRRLLGMVVLITAIVTPHLSHTTVQAVDSLCQTTYAGFATAPQLALSVRAVAATAEWETYGNQDTYGVPGFCWWDNNVEDGIGQEGIDCSGLVAKAWYLRPDYSTNYGYFQWSPTYYHRIAINSTQMYNTSSNPNWTPTAVGQRRLADAVVRVGHVFLYVQDLPSGLIQTLEARDRQVSKDVGYFSRSLASVDSEADGWRWRRRIGLA